MLSLTSVIAVGLAVLSAFAFAYAWAKSGSGLALMERRFAEAVLPSLELVGREKEFTRWFTFTVGGLLAAVSVGWLWSGVAGLAIGAVTAVSIPLLAARRLAEQRLEAVERQLPSALDALASALRSGQSLPQAVQWVSKEGPVPINHEFARLSRELALGRPLEEAIEDMAKRLPTGGLRSLSMTVGPLRAMGANLIPAFEGMADVLRRRQGSTEKLTSLTAQARMQLWVMGLILPVLTLLLYAMEPNLIGRLFTTFQGNLFLGMAGVLQRLAIVLARRILDPKGVFK